jgi:hypothetical protein
MRSLVQFVHATHKNAMLLFAFNATVLRCCYNTQAGRPNAHVTGRSASAAPVGWFLVGWYGVSEIPIIRDNKIQKYRAKKIYCVEGKHEGNHELNYARYTSGNLLDTRYFSDI